MNVMSRASRSKELGWDSLSVWPLSPSGKQLLSDLDDVGDDVSLFSPLLSPLLSLSRCLARMMLIWFYFNRAQWLLILIMSVSHLYHYLWIRIVNSGSCIFIIIIIIFYLFNSWSCSAVQWNRLWEWTHKKQLKKKKAEKRNDSVDSGKTGRASFKPPKYLPSNTQGWFAMWEMRWRTMPPSQEERSAPSASLPGGLWKIKRTSLAKTWVKEKQTDRCDQTCNIIDLWWHQFTGVVKELDLTIVSSWIQ